MRVAAADVLTGLDGAEVRELAATLAAAEACGVAAWCLDTAAEHAKVRVQFGRPIGQFQAVKHRCANMLLRSRRPGPRCGTRRAPRSTAGGAALASAWPRRSLPTRPCGTRKDCIQVLGGIGFTWEHDAHLYFRRAWRCVRWPAARPVRPAGRRRGAAGVRPPAELDVSPRMPARSARRPDTPPPSSPPPTARPAGAAGRGRLARAALADAVGPGRGSAGPARDPAGVRGGRGARPDLVIGAWVVPTLIGHGTPTQQRAVPPPTLRGELTWCQLFSEPGAGSDLAALSTRAERVEGGWRLTGQKVWTSVAQHADWGICLARTDPDVAKHRGISYFLVDMRTPGIDIRPLRELTGQAMFNEVFLDDVFVPDECLVGEPGDGWRLARTTLANERVALSSGWAMGAGVADLIALLGDRDPDDAVRQELGALVCAEQAFALLGLRATLRALSGLEPGPTSSIRKLLGIRHAQRVAEYGWSLLGPEGALLAGPAGTWPTSMLSTRSMSIAGGTTEVQLNILAERLLGLPRD